MKQIRERGNILLYSVFIILFYFFIMFVIGKEKPNEKIVIEKGIVNLSSDNFEENNKKMLLGEWKVLKNDEDSIYTEEEVFSTVPNLLKYEKYNKYNNKYSIELYSEVDIKDAIIYIELFLSNYTIYVDDIIVSWTKKEKNYMSEGFSYEYIPFSIEKGEKYSIVIELNSNIKNGLYKTPILDTFTSKKKDFLKNVLLSYVGIGILISGCIITFIISFLVKSKRFSYKYSLVLFLMLINLFFSEENMLINNIFYEKVTVYIVSIVHFLLLILLLTSLNSIVNEIFGLKKHNKERVILEICYYILCYAIALKLNISPLKRVDYGLIYIAIIAPNLVHIVEILKLKLTDKLKIFILSNYIFLLVNIYFSNVFFIIEMFYFDISLNLIISSILFSISLLTYYACEVRKTDEEALKVAMIERELVEKKMALLLSQIKPHFLYNTLATIQSMIKFDQENAYRAIGIFSRYLRVNMNSIDNIELIDIQKELEHINLYAQIEKIRFGDRVNIIYNINSKNIKVPSLTIQPLVENSIKHGICKKIEGGFVEIQTSEDEKNFYLLIIDNGVGFDINEIEKKNNSIGIKNVKYRLKEKVNAELVIDSSKEFGTKVTIIIPKKLEDKIL